MRKLILGFAAAALLALPASANQPSGDAAAANAQAQALGRLVYLHDQSAWHGTDALRAEIDFADHPELRGYVVNPLDNGHLGLVFFAEDADGFYEFARYEVAESKVVGGGLVQGEERVRLSPLLKRMVAARRAAVEEFQRRDWGLCTRHAANFVALPPNEDDVIVTYLLTSTEEAGVYPFGGHYRVDVGPKGEAVSARPFTNSCLNMELRRGPKGEEPIALGVSHLMDDHPTEIHYFQSYYVPAQVFVMIDGDVWAIEKGAFREMVDLGQ